MSTASPDKLMTVEELLALPEDKERMLIRGRLWAKPMTKRNRWHSQIEAQIAYLLNAWRQTQAEPRGRVFSGEAGFILSHDPASTVGIDVAYASAEVVARTPADLKWIDGPPVLAVEILSPSDKQKEIAAKVSEYLAVGVPLVWVVDPHFQTVVIHRPDAGPQLFHGDAELSGDPHLPGFRITVSQIFTF